MSVSRTTLFKLYSNNLENSFSRFIFITILNYNLKIKKMRGCMLLYYVIIKKRF